MVPGPTRLGSSHARAIKANAFIPVTSCAVSLLADEQWEENLDGIYPQNVYHPSELVFEAIDLMMPGSHSLRNAISALSFLAPLVCGKLLDSVSQLSNKEYDFVVIGGGTAGNVVANRLTEDKSISVLVIEAGVNNAGVEDSEVPFFCTDLIPATPWTWNYTTTPQPGMGGRDIPYPRGRLLGGSSSINFLVYSHGSSEDYDRYANVSGDPGWAWDAVVPFMRKNERFVPPTDHHNITGQFDPFVHGFDGQVEVSLAGFHQEIQERVVSATSQVDGFPYNEDMNSGKTIGIGYTQFIVGSNGRRSSSATSYLTASILARPNLDVVLNSQATKIIHTKSEKNVVTFGEVEFAPTSNHKALRRVTAKKEIIVSAGSINTPQLLMLSGIGNKTELKSHGIETLVDLPEVGQNLQDQPLMPNQFQVNSTNTLDQFSQNATLFNEQFELYNRTGTGLLTDGLSNLLGWLRIPENSSIFQNFSDPAAGPNSPHYELVFSNGFAAFSGPPPTTGNYMSVLTNVVSPLARGSITLNSTDPFDFPIIDPNLLGHPFDMFVMKTAIAELQRFMSAPVWADYVVTPFLGLSADSSDSELTDYIKNNTNSLYHPVGTSRMTAHNAKDGVVNPDLTVKQTKGLRVIDASVVPFIPGAHTQSVTYTFAERASDLIKQTWNLCGSS